MVKGKMPKTDTAETSSSTEIESIDDFKRVNESIKDISSMIDNLKPKYCPTIAVLCLRVLIPLKQI